MNAKQSLLDMIRSGTFYLLTDEQISRKLRLGRRESLAVRELLRSLVREGELLADGNFRYGTAEQFHAKRGTITGNERGFAFFTPDDGSGDLFLPRRSLSGALHGDTVLCRHVENTEDEGEVLAVLARGYREIVGTYRRESRGGYLVPDERRFTEEIFIPSGKNKFCGDGMKAVAHISSYAGRTPTGEIVEILGNGGDFLTEELSLIRAHGLREEFPQDVTCEADAAEGQDPLLSLKGREDFRDKLIVTVDGEDTRDIDDAISVEKKNGIFYLGVHIADVSHYVKRGSALDREAFARGTSVYFPDRVLPMLPKQLSNGICSLNEGVPRLTLSCLMEIDGRGKVLRRRIVPGVIVSRHRLTYTEVTAIASGDKDALAMYPDLVNFVRVATELTEILKRARYSRGGVELDIRETKILCEDGKISIPDYPRTISHEMIEQFMILANESVALFMTEKKMPFIYRVHERPSAEKADGFAEFLKESGIPPKFDPQDVSPADFRDVLAELKKAGSPLLPVVSRVMLRSMMKAVYSPENIGHFGLASECYCHFTSPIRRFPDLAIHRIIKQCLVDEARARAMYKEFVREAAARSTVCEQNATEAERDVDKLYIAVYMQDKIGEVCDAVISGVTESTLYAELSNAVEGFIPVDTLPDDYYTFVESHYLLRGGRHSFRLGDQIRVRVAGVDLGLRRVQFAFEGYLS